MRATCRLAALALLTATTSLYGQTSKPGDANGSGNVNVTDVLYLINYLFAGGPAPLPPDGTVILPGGVPLVTVKLQAGIFQMGSPEAERNRGTDETLHQVTLTQGFYIGKYAVTQAQWLAVMGAPMPSSCGAYGIGPSYPVYCVSWDDISGAGGFLEKLNEHLTSTNQPGAGKFRLPTEAQREYAARAGTLTRFSFGDALDCVDTDCTACATAAPHVAWCGSKQGEHAEPVGQKVPNGFGLYDMHGNVFEWVNDWYGAYPLTGSGFGAPQTDPTGPASGSSRVARGGLWADLLRYSRSAFRRQNDSFTRSFAFGFRLARSL